MIQCCQVHQSSSKANDFKKPPNTFKPSDQNNILTMLPQHCIYVAATLAGYAVTTEKCRLSVPLLQHHFAMFSVYVVATLLQYHFATLPGDIIYLCDPYGHLSVRRTKIWTGELKRAWRN